MLGWQIGIERKHGENRPGQPRLLAAWLAGLDGTDWLDDLVAHGQAKDLGQNHGYPCRCEVTAGVLLALLRQGVPQHDKGPLVIGDDYTLPAGRIWDVRIDMAQLEAMPADEPLLVEAWDQS